MSERADETLQIGPGILALVLPGLGHVALGKGRRGALIALGVLGLFFGGVLIGGVDAVDSKNDRWWFMGQAGVGPVAFAVDALNQRLSASDPPETAGPGWSTANPPARWKSLAHSNEMGMLFATVAGMLNVIAIVDAFWNTSTRGRRDRRVVGALEGGGRR